MTVYDLRIVNSGGGQPWRGHNREDERHPTLPLWRGTRPSDSTTRVQAYSMLPLKCFASVAGWVQTARHLLRGKYGGSLAPALQAPRSNRKRNQTGRRGG